MVKEPGVKIFAGSSNLGSIDALKLKPGYVLIVDKDFNVLNIDKLPGDILVQDDGTVLVDEYNNGNNTNIPYATKDDAGVIKVGDGLVINSKTGVLSVGDVLRLIYDKTQVVHGQVVFNKLPKAYGTPTNPEDIVTKAYIDSHSINYRIYEDPNGTLKFQCKVSNGSDWEDISIVSLKIVDKETYSDSNPLVTKNYVDKVVPNFRGSFANWNAVPSDSSGYKADYSGNREPTNNDYIVVQDASDYSLVPQFIQSDLRSIAIRSLAYGNNLFVAGSDNSGLYYSTDGMTWTQSNINSGGFVSLTYGNNLFIAGSYSDSGLYYSTDGMTWIQSNIKSDYFTSLSYGNNLFVAGSDSDSGLYYSTDGMTWIQSNINSGYFRMLVYGNSLFVTGSINGLYYSTDGITWTQSNISSGDFISLAYGNNIYVAGSGSYAGLYYSTDGITWTQSNINSGDFISLSYGNNLFVAGSPSSVYGIYYANTKLIGTWRFRYTGSWSTEGKSGWTEEYQVNETPLTQEQLDALNSGITQSKVQKLDGIENNAQVNSIESISVNDTEATIEDKKASIILDKLVAGSDNNVYGKYKVADPSIWNQSNITSGDFNSLAYGNNLFVAGSNHGLYYSTDGMTWIQSNINSGDFSSLTYGNSLFVAGSNSDNGLYYSTDGITWTQSNINSGYFASLSYGNNVYVAGSNSDNGLYYSTDGIIWTQSNISSGSFESLTYGNSIFVAGSNSDAGLYYSNDGINWNQSNISFGSFYSLAYGNNLFVAGSDAGLYYSNDGINWNQSNITSGDFNSLAYGNNLFIAGSNHGLYYSTDGINWNQSNISSGSFYSLAYGNGAFIAGRSNGLYYSNKLVFNIPLINNKLLNNQTFELSTDAGIKSALSKLLTSLGGNVVN